VTERLSLGKRIQQRRFHKGTPSHALQQVTFILPNVPSSGLTLWDIRLAGKAKARKMLKEAGRGACLQMLESLEKHGLRCPN
jgi:hypothetical protein